MRPKVCLVIAIFRVAKPETVVVRIGVDAVAISFMRFATAQDRVDLPGFCFKKNQMLTICNRNFCTMNLNICDGRYTEYLFKHGIPTLVDLFAVRARPASIAVDERLNGCRVIQTSEVLFMCEISARTRQAGKVLYTIGPNN